MGYKSRKKLPGFCITYFHNIQNCFKCKSAMESNLQIGSPRKFLCRRKDMSTDIIQHKSSKLSLKAKLNKQTFRLSKQRVQVELKKILLQENLKETLFLPIKTLLDIPRKKLVFKKKNSTKVNAVMVKSFTSDNKLKKLKHSKSTKEKSAVLENVKSNSGKKSSPKSADKKNGTKVPGKGTLKRKRWICDQYNQENENYEDDMYENKKFEHFQSLLGDDSDGSVKFEELKTPDFPFSLSPRATTPSPTYKDCYDLAQLKKYRAKAQEYMHCRNKKKKKSSSENIKEAPQVEQHSVSTDDVTNKLEQVVKILNDCYSNNEKAVDMASSEKDSGSEEDDYYSDLLDSQNAIEPIR